LRFRVVDNLSNTLDVLDGIQNITGVRPVLKKDFKRKDKVQVKRHHDISGVIHFAASKAVGESVENPLLYYENNINALVYILQELQQKQQPILF
jgi:UDP-glucose 4-epimerase